MEANLIQYVGTTLFFLAVLHTFLMSPIKRRMAGYPEHSWQVQILHYASEVESIFAFWAIVFLFFLAFVSGWGALQSYLENTTFTEPVFVFVIMFVASTKPIIRLTENIIIFLSKRLPLGKKLSYYLTLMLVGPLLGSLITEPAAMTVSSLILLEKFYQQQMSDKFKYATIGLLFVSISIGGTLTHFAAPPVVMVAGKWGWDAAFMLQHFGLKAALAIFISTLSYVWFFRRELVGDISLSKPKNSGLEPPSLLVLIHALFLLLVVLGAHHVNFLLAILILFLALLSLTSRYQYAIKLESSLMVGIFLASLVLLGQQQTWWLQPLLTSISDSILYWAATLLTAVTDNAALTYLGSLVELSDSAKYYLVAGGVTGGGLTVIANAPNPVGYGILKVAFAGGIINAGRLFLFALFPTLVAATCFLLL